MRRIMHVISTPQGIGGAERVLIALVQAGTKRGWSQLVLNPFSRAGDGSELAHALGDVYRHHPAESLRDIWAVRRWLDGNISAFQPDIVHAHLFHALVLVGSLRRSAGTLTLLNHQHGDRKRSEGKSVQAFLDEKFGKRFDHVVACSEAVRRFLVDACGYDAQRVTVIRNGWTGRPLPRSGSNRFVVVCVANMRPAKGHELLVEGFAEFHQEVPEARLLLVGDGPLRSRVARQVRDRGIEDAVEFTGAVDDVWPQLARADVAVLPSHNETFGIAALEAMAAGLPVVATRVGGIPELVEDGITGRLVPPRDVSALCRAFHFLYSNRSQADAMGRAGAEKASDMTVERMAKRYFSLYERLSRDGAEV